MQESLMVKAKGLEVLVEKPQESIVMNLIQQFNKIDCATTR